MKTPTQTSEPEPLLSLFDKFDLKWVRTLSGPHPTTEVAFEAFCIF